MFRWLDMMAGPAICGLRTADALISLGDLLRCISVWQSTMLAHTQLLCQVSF